MKVCAKCGNTERFSPQGLCLPCQAARMRDRRAKGVDKGIRPRSGASPGRPKRRAEGRGKGKEELRVARKKRDGGHRAFAGSEMLLEALREPKARLTFMVARHEATLAEFDQQKELLTTRLREAEESGFVADARHYMGELRKLLGQRADYDLRMSKELAIWQQFAVAEVEETPITFVFVDLLKGMATLVDPPMPAGLET